MATWPRFSLIVRDSGVTERQGELLGTKRQSRPKAKEASLKQGVLATPLENFRDLSLTLALMLSKLFQRISIALFYDILWLFLRMPSFQIAYFLL